MSVSLVRVQGPAQDDEICGRSDFKIPLTLPAILGRGSLLKCGEKKLSRRHACLDWDDDDLLLTSTHQNPTYVVVSGEEKQLSNGSSLQLSDGDKFGLLENGFWFRINLSNQKIEKEKALSSNGTPDEDSIKRTPEEVDTDKNGNEEDKALENVAEIKDEQQVKENGEDKENEEMITEDAVSNGYPDVDKEDGLENTSPKKKITEDLQAAVLSRKRDLPSWLMKTSPAAPKEKGDAQKTPTKHTHGGDRKPSSSVKRKRPESKETTPAKAKRQAVSDSDATPTKKARSPKKPQQTKNHDLSDESDSDEELPKQRKNQTPATPKKGAMQSPSPRKTPKKSPKQNAGRNHDMSDESDDEEETASTTTTPVKPKKAPRKNADSDNETSGATSTAASTPSPRKRKRRARKPCQYGSSCYRKNPDHKKEFAHIGDSDYKEEEESESEDSDDDRPQCEYGIDCYRSNKKHRSEYRHSRVPQPKRRAKQRAQRKKKQNEGDSDEEYDYDDPFLNDESSDDYAPTDDDSDSPLEDAEEEDNTRRMLKEAKKFIKKR